MQLNLVVVQRIQKQISNWQKKLHLPYLKLSPLIPKGEGYQMQVTLLGLFNQKMRIKMYENTEQIKQEERIQFQKCKKYDKQQILLKITFKQEYPFKPPTIKFLKKMNLQNIQSDGSVCCCRFDKIGNKWSAVFQLKDVINEMLSILGGVVRERTLSNCVHKDDLIERQLIKNTLNKHDRYWLLSYEMNPLQMCHLYEPKINKEGALVQIKMMLIGPEDTAFEGGRFHVLIEPELQYDKVTVITPMFHPNISEKGQLICCADSPSLMRRALIIQGGVKKIYPQNFRQIGIGLIDLLKQPFLDRCRGNQKNQAKMMFKNDRNEWENKAQQYTFMYAFNK